MLLSDKQSTAVCSLIEHRVECATGSLCILQKLKKYRKNVREIFVNQRKDFKTWMWQETDLRDVVTHLPFVTVLALCLHSDLLHQAIFFWRCEVFPVQYATCLLSKAYISLASTMMTAILRCLQGKGCSVRPYSVASIKINPLQEAALEEQCILVDDHDQPVGNATKRDCHRLGKDGKLLLHRAFSVFLFNSKNELLLQRRSPHKITFPNCFTNACCSHPLYNIPGEREETAALGVLRAAQRRLQHELGIHADMASPEALQYLTRIHYKANDTGMWGEHEIDYIIFLHKDVPLNPNPEEVSEVCYLSRNQMDTFIKTVPLTPWFRLIMSHKLHLWWDNLHSIEQFKDHSTIYKLS